MLFARVTALVLAFAACGSVARAQSPRTQSPRTQSPRTQSPRDEARAATLRATARERTREGHLEEAFALVRSAAELTDDARVWLEVAEAADRLRLDEVALRAYETYLERRADAPDREEIEARTRVLREVLAGHRYALESEPARGPAAEVLVDWNGEPVVVERSGTPRALADWDGTLRALPGSRPPDLLPFPTDNRGLGRRLSAPGAAQPNGS